MLNICLCDDDIKVLDYYTERIRNILNKNNYEFKIESFMSGGSLLFELEEEPNKFNIIILDIIMKNINGIETAKTLRKYGYNGIIIFLSSSREFALDSFEVEPLNYILKNNKEDKFDEIFLKAVASIQEEYSKNIIISYKSQNKIININTILYMESLNKKIIIYKTNGEVEHVNCGLNEIYLKIKELGFIRCHKSYIVNIKYVEVFNSQECGIKNNIILPIGRKYLSSFRDRVLENEFNNLII